MSYAFGGVVVGYVVTVAVLLTDRSGSLLSVFEVLIVSICMKLGRRGLSNIRAMVLGVVVNRVFLVGLEETRESRVKIRSGVSVMRTTR